jgi:hypothetical protein
MLLRVRSHQLTVVLANAARASDVSAAVRRPPPRTLLVGGLLGGLNGGVFRTLKRWGHLTTTGLIGVLPGAPFSEGPTDK